MTQNKPNYFDDVPCLDADCPCPKAMTTTSWEEQLMDEFAVMFSRAERDYDDLSGDWWVEKMVAFIRNVEARAREEERERIIGIAEKYKIFTPTCGHDSEEEKGFQKGMTAGEQLFKREILVALRSNQTEE